MPKHCHHHNCIEELKSDHQNILRYLDVLELVIDRSTIDHHKVKNFLHFTETFAEPHHQKEEQVLFPALEKKGIPNEGGPIGMMLIEHTAKREYIAQMREALQKNDNVKLKENAKTIISLLRDHIYKEDNILYPCAQDVLTEQELASLASRCNQSNLEG